MDDNDREEAKALLDVTDDADDSILKRLLDSFQPGNLRETVIGYNGLSRSALWGVLGAAVGAFAGLVLGPALIPISHELAAGAAGLLGLAGGVAAGVLLSRSKAVNAELDKQEVAEIAVRTLELELRKAEADLRISKVLLANDKVSVKRDEISLQEAEIEHRRNRLMGKNSIASPDATSLAAQNANAS